MPAVRRSSILTLSWKFHSWLYRASGGRLGSTISGFPVLLLTTTGRTSGQARTVALNFVPQGTSFVVAASNAGDDRDPAWFRNLEAQPGAMVQLGRRVVRVRARRARGAERQELYRQFVERHSSYAEYQQRTDREIPVVVLETVP